MSKTLIHYNTDGSPVGIWRQTPTGGLQSYYPDSDSKWEKRGKAVVEEKESDRSTDDFFDHLTDHSSYFDHFGTIDSEDNEPLESIWHRTKNESNRGA